MARSASSVPTFLKTLYNQVHAPGPLEYLARVLSRVFRAAARYRTNFHRAEMENERQRFLRDENGSRVLMAHGVIRDPEVPGTRVQIYLRGPIFTSYRDAAGFSPRIRVLSRSSSQFRVLLVSQTLSRLVIIRRSFIARMTPAPRASPARVARGARDSSRVAHVLPS